MLRLWRLFSQSLLHRPYFNGDRYEPIRYPCSELRVPGLRLSAVHVQCR